MTSSAPLSASRSGGSQRSSSTESLSGEEEAKSRQGRSRIGKQSVILHDAEGEPASSWRRSPAADRQGRADDQRDSQIVRPQPTRHGAWKTLKDYRDLLSRPRNADEKHAAAMGLLGVLRRRDLRRRSRPRSRATKGDPHPEARGRRAGGSTDAPPLRAAPSPPGRMRAQVPGGSPGVIGRDRGDPVHRGSRRMTVLPADAAAIRESPAREYAGRAASRLALETKRGFVPVDAARPMTRQKSRNSPAQSSSAPENS